jgi:hypothetical protein
MSADDPRNELGSLPPAHERWCAEQGRVFAVLHQSPVQRHPFTVSSNRPLSVVACAALSEADEIVREGAGLAVAAAVPTVHCVAS